MLTDCREYRSRLIDLARSPRLASRVTGTAPPEDRRTVMAHVERCAACARLFEDQLALSAAFHSLADDASVEMAEIEPRVMAEFDRAALNRAASRRKSTHWVFAAVGLAAAAVFGFIRVERRPPVVHRAPVESVVTPASMEAPARVSVAGVRHVKRRIPPRQTSHEKGREEGQPFVPIPYTVPLGPDERATIVRMQVPVAALIAVGFRIQTSDPGGVIDADVLVSQDGRARAIRVNSKEEDSK